MTYVDALVISNIFIAASMASKAPAVCWVLGVVWLVMSACMWFTR